MIDICDKILEKVAEFYGVGFRETTADEIMGYLDYPAKRSKKFSEDGIDIFVGQTVDKRVVIMIDFVAYGEWFTYYFIEREEV